MILLKKYDLTLLDMQIISFYISCAKSIFDNMSRRREALVEKLESSRTFTRISIILDPNLKRILRKALEVYRDADNFKALLRRVIEDWYHYRRVLLTYRDQLEAVFKEMSRMNSEIEDLKREIKEVKELIVTKVAV